MSSNVSLLNLLLSVLLLQVTKECSATNPHPFANLQFTPKEEYYNNYPPPDARYSYNVPYAGGNFRIQYAPPPLHPLPPVNPLPPPPPPPPQRFFVEEPTSRNPNIIRDEEDDARSNQKNLYKSPKDHFLHKREALIRPKVIPKPVPLPHRTKLLVQKPAAPPPAPPAPPAQSPHYQQPPCNCNQGYF